MFYANTNVQHRRPPPPPPSQHSSNSVSSHSYGHNHKQNEEETNIFGGGIETDRYACFAMITNRVGM